MAANHDKRILVVEDEEPIRKGLLDVLAYHGYAPRGAERGDEGLAVACSEEFALVLLDVMLPGMNGFDVCEALRALKPRLPILMLTARGAEADVLRGFRCGSDDYVTKPFSVAELMARVESLLRRAAPPSASAPDAEPFQVGGVDGWEIEPAGRSACRRSETVALTARELDLLAILHREKGRIVSRRLLLCELWGYPDPDRVETRTVDMHVAKLRKKLDAAEWIETVRGEGYRIPR